MLALSTALALAPAGCGAIQETLHPADVAAPDLGRPWRAPDVVSARPLPDEEPSGVASPRAPDGSRVALEQLLDDALRTNPQTERAWQDARAALAEWDVQRGRYLPRLYGNVSVVDRRELDVDGKQPLVDAVRAPGIAIDYLLFDFGRRAAAVESARQAATAACWSAV